MSLLSILVGQEQLSAKFKESCYFDGGHTNWTYCTQELIQRVQGDPSIFKTENECNLVHYKCALGYQYVQT